MTVRRAETLVISAPSRSLPRNSVWLLLGRGFQLGSGFLFWVVAARTASVVDVGVAAAAVSAVMLCTQLGILGTGSAVIIALGDGESRAHVLDTAFSIVTVAGLLAAGGYLVFTGVGGSELSEAHTVQFMGLFAMAAVLGTLIICLDQVSIALRRTEGAVTRYGIGGTVSLTAVVLAATLGDDLTAAGLLACWSLSALTAVLVGFVQLRWWAGYRFRPAFRIGDVRTMVRVGVPNQLLTLTERLSPALVPIILAHVVSPTMTAYWYPAWMMAWVAFTAPVMVGMQQFADIVRSPGQARRVISQGMLWSGLLGGVLMLVLAGGAPLFLSALGSDYADASVMALRILALGLLPFLVLQAYNAMCRAVGRTREAIVLGLVVMGSVCGGTALLGHRGTSAVALVWVVSTGVAAVWAAWRLRVGLREAPVGTTPSGVLQAPGGSPRARDGGGRDG